MNDINGRCPFCKGPIILEEGVGWWCLDPKCHLSKKATDIKPGDKYVPAYVNEANQNLSDAILTLTNASHQFTSYADIHRARGKEDKALVNESWAKACAESAKKLRALSLYTLKAEKPDMISKEASEP